MDKFLRLASVFFLTFITFSNVANAQCSQCTPDLTCQPTNPQSPFAICPTAPADINTNVFYEETITLFVAESFEPQPGIIVTIDEIEVLDFTGLPTNLVWSTNTPDNIFYPSQSEHNCIKVCGITPDGQGTYGASVFVRFVANAGAFGVFEDTIDFPVDFTVASGGGSGKLFTLFPRTGCAPLNVAATNNFQESVYQPIPGITQGFVYEWNFGNGDSSNLPTPSAVTYNQQGAFPVDYTLVIDTFGFFLNEFRITSLGCSDIGSDPDVYVEIYDADSLVFTSIDNPVEASDSVVLGVNLKLVNPPYTVEVWDAGGAGGLLSGDLTTDNCVNGTTANAPTQLSLPAIDAYGTSVLNQINGSLAFEYVIVKPVVMMTETDSVIVNGTISASPTVTATAFDVCVGTPATLVVNQSFDTYQWFLDGQIIAGETTDALTTDVPGSYTVQVTEAGNACDAISAPISIGQLPSPDVPLVERSNDTLFTQVVAAGYQWYRDGLGLVGEDQSFIVANVSGTYTLAVFNTDGCGTYSKPESVNVIGIEEEIQGLGIYPNPTSGLFTLRFNKTTSATTSIRIMDLSGRTVFQTRVQARGNIETQIDMSQFNQGMYLVEVQGSTGRIVEKLLVQ